ncbi:hypothetical protein QEV83_09215 [Methylocapsa sp. D3K7]|uniref:hypothetical protein n=1 Tax=Methylocapsa sp. D3K7 TaxID=3041435 RepID=UPI00244ED7D5|nr:hypothetical protein [Methylocapsa sp. D3K7]WGJ16391.1 hypothetical protein QEV83_09215 [Methylocapsa sp. D3K7]
MTFCIFLPLPQRDHLETTILVELHKSFQVLRKGEALHHPGRREIIEQMELSTLVEIVDRCGKAPLRPNDEITIEKKLYFKTTSKEVAIRAFIAIIATPLIGKLSSQIQELT